MKGRVNMKLLEKKTHYQKAISLIVSLILLMVLLSCNKIDQKVINARESLSKEIAISIWNFNHDELKNRIDREIELLNCLAIAVYNDSNIYYIGKSRKMEEILEKEIAKSDLFPSEDELLARSLQNMKFTIPEELAKIIGKNTIENSFDNELYERQRELNAILAKKKIDESTIEVIWELKKIGKIVFYGLK
jgi:hypothetical protein